MTWGAGLAVHQSRDRAIVEYAVAIVDPNDEPILFPDATFTNKN